MECVACDSVGRVTPLQFQRLIKTAVQQSAADALRQSVLTNEQLDAMEQAARQ